jgi:hypothetical protein
VACVSVLIVAALLVLIFGQVHGVEFSPRTFRQRSFTFFQVPLAGIQITPIWQIDQTGELETHLKLQGLLSKVQQGDRWDVAWVAEGGRMRNADALILLRYLEVLDSSDRQHWLVWSTEQPELAKAFWPAVQRVAWQQAYVLLPELFEMAQHATDADALQQQIDQYLSPALAELAQDQAGARSQQTVVPE